MKILSLTMCLMLSYLASSASADVGSIQGTVTDTSAASVANATVAAVLSGDVAVAVLTDSGGNFTISDLPPDTYAIRVVVNGFEMRTISSVVVHSGATTSQDVQDLAPEGVIEGKITLNDGTTAIANCIVVARLNADFAVSTLSDDSGLWRVDKLKAGTYSVAAVKDDYGFSTISNVSVSVGATVENTDIVGFNGAASGTITKADGTTAIADAIVSAHVSGSTLVGAATTASDGTYTIKGLATGTISITVSVDGRDIGSLDSVSITDGSTVPNLNVSEGGGSISGCVQVSGGSGVENVKIVAISKTKGFFLTTTTDSSGNYSIGCLPTDTYCVRLQSTEYGSKMLSSISVVSGEDSTGKNFTVLTGGSIAGTVKNGDGDPISGAIVAVVYSDSTEANLTTTSSIGTTASDGTFSLGGLDTAKYMVVSFAEGYVSGSVDGVSVTSGQASSGNDIVLSTVAGSISGTVFQSDGVTPIPGAHVVAYSAGGSLVIAATDTDGHYLLDPLKAGTYHVFALSNEFGQGSSEDVTVSGTGDNAGNDISME